MTTENNCVLIKNSGFIQLKEIPLLDIDEFTKWIIQNDKENNRVAALFGVASDNPDQTNIYAIVINDEQSSIYVSSSVIKNGSYQSLTPSSPQVHLFEREIAEQFGVIPKDHPWFKPVRYIHSWGNNDAWGRGKDQSILPCCGDFYKVEGEQVHEVAVGPVHAGIIEPGHFRFQCHGEEVFHLEIALGYQHRGIEESIIGGPNNRTIHYIENIAGDTAIGHTICYSQIIESLYDIKTSAKAQSLRAIALELERLANHVGDLGALANDVGYLPTASYCGRIRGDYLNLTALLCGNRFGRSFIKPGGVEFDIDKARIDEFKKKLEVIERDTISAITLLWDNQSVLSRFENTGVITKNIAMELGLVGVAARACGIERDIRYNLPTEIYRFSQVPISNYETGDVFARAYVRWLEIQRSIEFIKGQLHALPSGEYYKRNDNIQLKPDCLAVSLTEGWRGEICHVALTDSNGKLSRYKIVDPSFHNWTGLAMALRNQQISDFPLCNKSFNLSYCGHDL